MKRETEFATVENVVTAICFGVGALLVVLALYTLVAVKTVSADTSPLSVSIIEKASLETSPAEIGTSPLCCGSASTRLLANSLKG